MSILVTGVAGFIGFHASKALLSRGETIVGIDNLNDYYDPSLKQARLEQLSTSHFTFHHLNIADYTVMESLRKQHSDITHVIHLAAQPGVRYSLINPHAYTESNLTGHLNILELCRRLPNLRHLIYASSSSVYGGNTKLPFRINDPVNTPISLYAATKRSSELMARTYSHLYGIPATGLRFFTVYGPWGRPDMATFLFTKAILEEQPIRVFNNGDMHRDFTYIDDIVDGILAALYAIPEKQAAIPPHRLFNLGNSKSEKLLDFIKVIEESTGKKATIKLEPLQPGDIKDTYADIAESTDILGFSPRTTIYKGIPKFVQWYKEYYDIS